MSKAVYSDIIMPEIVRKAIALARQLGFPLMPEGRQPGYQWPPSACIPQVGRLLQVLASGKPGVRIGEQETGAGVGTAWLASGLTGSATLLSVDINVHFAEAVADLFRDDPQVTIQTDDWHAVMHNGEPFDLLFMDAMSQAALAYEHWDMVTELVAIGGQIVMDELTPVALWPPDWENAVDYKREFAFENPRVVGTEVLTTTTTAALIVTRIH